MGALDLLVHTAHAEPFGRVLIEAMAAGRPVVAYRDGGVPEVVADGETAILAAPGQISELARATSRLVADRAARVQMGKAGQERARRLFGADVMARRVEAVYHEILGAGQEV
jgi:glycosyltransferase involved in cell wall biosynthesis